MSCPKKVIDWDRVDKLLSSGCLGTEVAAYFGIHPETFYDRVKDKYGVVFSEYIQQKRSHGDALLREKQYDKAIEGENMMLIWLGKNRLNQTDSQTNVSVAADTVKSFNSIMAQITNAQSRSCCSSDDSNDNSHT
jgi:AraC-like DNA-binding protein